MEIILQFVITNSKLKITEVRDQPCLKNEILRYSVYYNHGYNLRRG